MLCLDKIEEINLMKEYLHNKADIYIRPLCAYLIKNKPMSVYQGIKNWLESEGEELRKNVEKE